MPLMLDEIRKEFAKKLSEQEYGRYSMDVALAYVVELAYNLGLEEGQLIGDAS